MISPLERWYRLVPRGCPGLVCDAAGVALGAVDLARAGLDAGGVNRCEVRSETAIETILRLAYGPRADAVVSRLYHGLRRAARWIEAGDLCLASIEMVLLGVPDLTAEGMAKLAEIANLEKSGTGWENQPRIAGGQAGGGQWTTDGGGVSVTDSAFVGTAALALDDGVYRPSVAAPALDDGVYRPGVDHLVPSPVAGIEDEPFRGSNGPPPDEITSLKQVFPGFEPGATAAILAPIDGFLGFSALGDEVNLAAAVATYRRLFAEIKSIDPTFVDAEILPEGGIAGLSWEGRNSLIDHLLMARASALYRLRGDIGPLQVETLRFLQKRVDDAYADGVKEYDAGRLKPRLSREEAIGNYIDDNVRSKLKMDFSFNKISFGAGTELTINNRDYDTSTSKRTYTVPDARVGDISFDWTLTPKTISNKQIRGFFAADSNPSGVVIIRPTQIGGNNTYLIPRPIDLQPRR